MSRSALLMLLVAAAGAADAGAALDAETARRAQELAEAYERGADEPAGVVDPLAAEQLAEAELLLLEAEEAVARGKATDATKPFLTGSRLLRAIEPTRRAGLEKRLRAADARLTKLARALLATPDLLPGAEHATDAEPVATVPAAVPATSAHEAAPGGAIDAAATPADDTPVERAAAGD
ncbi:MAG TPA: hypothetical protein VEL07_18760 [Planctomycetota bacterium]|nr:hypothetical protein [Planctomycetota bacterium]